MAFQERPFSRSDHGSILHRQAASQEDHFMADGLESPSLALTPQCDVAPWNFSQQFSSGGQMIMQTSSAGYNPAGGWISSGESSLARFAHDTTPEVPYHQVSETDPHNGGSLSSMTTPVAASPSMKAIPDKQGAASRSKRRRSQQAPSPESFSLSPNTKGSKTRLRSASRASKNANHNPPATAEEKRSRECHNQVEKQYRNRLNAQFESLLDALPENMRRGESSNDGDHNYEGFSSAERKVSRAEVLDMARRHIKLLERECALLEGERDDLRDNVVKLRYFYGRCENGDVPDAKVPFRA